MTKAEHAERMALTFERWADKAAASAEPWWLGNLRTYQNFACKWWAIHYAELDKERACSST